MQSQEYQHKDTARATYKHIFQPVSDFAGELA